MIKRVRHYGLRSLMWGAMLFCASLLSSCSFFDRNEYEAVRLYDVGVPSMTSRYTVDIRPFASDTAARYKMLYRTAASELKTDEYNRWTLPPSQMITKYLRMAFAVDRAPGEECADNRFVVTGNILSFEADLISGKARLCVAYEIKLPDSDKVKPYVSSLNIDVPLESHTASAYAAAMSIAAARLAATLQDDIQAFAEKNCKQNNK